MSGILVLGSGGHGKVVADILRSGGSTVLGFLDDAADRHGSSVLNLPILGAIADYSEHPSASFVLGIGANHTRQQIVARLEAGGALRWHNAIHPRAIVAPSAQLGHGIVIAAGSVVNPDAVIGNHAIINTGATIDHDSIVGDFAHIAPGAHLAGQVTIGIGALVGVGAAVVPSRSIGDWAVVGAGAVVISSIPGGVTAKGVPARW